MSSGEERAPASSGLFISPRSPGDDGHTRTLVAPPLSTLPADKSESSAVDGSGDGMPANNAAASKDGVRSKSNGPPTPDQTPPVPILPLPTLVPGKRKTIEELVKALTDKDKGLFPTGVTCKQLLEFVNGMPEAERPNRSKNHLQVLLSRSVDRGKLIRLAPKIYTTFDRYMELCPDALAVAPVKDKEKKLSSVIASVVSESSQMLSNSVVNGQTSPAPILEAPFSAKRKADNQGKPRLRRKRTKKTMGPDFVEFGAEKSKGRNDVCDHCLLPPSVNFHGKSEALLYCTECPMKVHPSCLGYSPTLATRCRRSPWQCSDCKVCVVCSMAGDAATLLFCDECDQGYHMECHQPPVTEKPPGCWACASCSAKLAKKKPTKKTRNGFIQNGDIQSKPSDSKIPSPPGSSSGESNSTAAHKAEIVPVCDCDASWVLPDLTQDRQILAAGDNASEWTVEQVEEFFSTMGFPAQAGAFLEQEVDGQALLLMKRSDVLNRLSLKLGPALKLYRRILALQQVYERKNGGMFQDTDLNHKAP